MLHQADEPISPSLDPLGRSAFGPAEARRLLWRAGFGGTPAEVASLASFGPDWAVDRLLGFPPDPADGDAPARPGVIREWTDDERAAARRARQRRDEDTLALLRQRRQAMLRADRAMLADLQTWWLARLIDSPHPAREKLTLFWHGHFATSHRGQRNAYHLFLQNRLFRRLALGPFDDLLRGMIRDPAMLAYLNNNVSRRRKPNENLARELLELFTLGEGNYSERDIKEGARALTGYTFRGDEFLFREDWHDGDTKTILGVRGQLDGDGFVGAILRRPECSRFIAHRLYRLYAADIPDDPARTPAWAEPVIAGLADRIRRARYDLRPAVRDLLRSAHFYDPGLAGAKIKSPVEMVASTARALGARPDRLGGLVLQLARLGQALFLPPSVSGWDGGRAWITASTLVHRQNVAAYVLAAGDPRDAFPDAPDADAYSRGLVAHLLGGAPDSPAGRRAMAALGRFFTAHDYRLTRATAVAAAALVAAVPEYQTC